MDLQPLRDLVERHGLETEPAYSLLDVTAQLGEAARELLRATAFGRHPTARDVESAERMQAKIGDLMFAVAYLSTLYEVDPEAALWESVRRFEAKLPPTEFATKSASEPTPTTANPATANEESSLDV